MNTVRLKWLPSGQQRACELGNTQGKRFLIEIPGWCGSFFLHFGGCVVHDQSTFESVGISLGDVALGHLVGPVWPCCG